MENKVISKRNIIYMILLLVVIIATGTFAWLNWRTKDTMVSLTIGEVNSLKVTLTPYQINATLSPVSNYTSNTNVIVIDVTADNPRTVTDEFTLHYQIDTIDEELIDEGFKYTITKCTANCNNPANYVLLNNAGGDFSEAESNTDLSIYSESVPGNTTYKYKVYLWIDSSGGNQANMQNKTFKGELGAKVFTKNLYAKIIENSAPLDTWVSFNSGTSLSSNNGNGILLHAGTETDQYPVYYYRGTVTNNNILFAGFCWKMMRTTSTGGIKIVYFGLPSNGACDSTNGDTTLGQNKFNDNSDSIADVGYMYGTRYAIVYDSYDYSSTIYAAPDVSYNNGEYTLTGNQVALGYAPTNYYNAHYTCGTTSTTCENVKYIIHYITGSRNYTIYYITLSNNKKIEDALTEMFTNTNDSVIKTFLDSWYEDNMTDYTSMLEDTPWCNDRSIYQLGPLNPNGGTVEMNTYTYFSTYNRVTSHQLTITCNKNDAFTVTETTTGNGKLTYPVGLLTMEEYNLAGTATGTLIHSYYLTPNSNNNLSISPQQYYNGNSFVYAPSAELYAVGTSSNYAYVRPVVSLKNSTKYAYGDGTAENPYVIN